MRRGVLRDPNGNPLAGASVRVGGSKGGGQPSDESRTEALLRAHSMRLNGRMAAAVQTDAEGRFELRFYEVPGLVLLASASGSGATLRLEPGADWELIGDSR